MWCGANDYEMPRFLSRASISAKSSSTGGVPAWRPTYRRSSASRRPPRDPVGLIRSGRGDRLAADRRATIPPTTQSTTQIRAGSRPDQNGGGEDDPAGPTDDRHHEVPENPQQTGADRAPAARARARCPASTRPLLPRRHAIPVTMMPSSARADAKGEQNRISGGHSSKRATATDRIPSGRHPDPVPPEAAARGGIPPGDSRLESRRSVRCAAMRGGTSTVSRCSTNGPWPRRPSPVTPARRRCRTRELLADSRAAPIDEAYLPSSRPCAAIGCWCPSSPRPPRLGRTSEDDLGARTRRPRCRWSASGRRMGVGRCSPSPGWTRSGDGTHRPTGARHPGHRGGGRRLSDGAAAL